MHEPEHFSSYSLFRARAHAAHSEQLEALLKLVETTDRTPRRLQELETALLAHLRAEEELILPDFGLLHATEAARIRAEHDQIRQLLVRSDVAQGEEALRATLAQLSKLVRDCSAFEERQLYPWAEQQLRASKKGEFVQRTQRQSLVGPSFHWQI
jgi:Hemerythrin HHE cation binding domain